MEKGVRQGDPLSPFLFIIMMEKLNVIMKTTCEIGLFKGVKIPQANLPILHLFYTDDALFVGEWERSNLKNWIEYSGVSTYLQDLKLIFASLACLVSEQTHRRWRGGQHP